MIVFYNKRARVSAFPFKYAVFGEKIPISQRGTKQENLGFYNATLNDLLQPQRKKNLYETTLEIERT